MTANATHYDYPSITTHHVHVYTTRFMHLSCLSHGIMRLSCLSHVSAYVTVPLQLSGTAVACPHVCGTTIHAHAHVRVRYSCPRQEERGSRRRCAATRQEERGSRHRCTARSARRCAARQPALAIRPLFRAARGSRSCIRPLFRTARGSRSCATGEFVSSAPTLKAADRSQQQETAPRHSSSLAAATQSCTTRRCPTRTPARRDSAQLPSRTTSTAVRRCPSHQLPSSRWVSAHAGRAREWSYSLSALGHIDAISHDGHGQHRWTA